MEAKLSVEIGAQIGELNAQFARATATVQKVAADMGVSVGKIERQFALLNNTKFTFGSNFQTASGKLAVEAQRTSMILGGSMVKSSNQAAFALTNLGRVAQDAPFGFIGIQNNLNPLLESFQMLKQQTGSTGSALKALGSSLIGVGGLGIALSVVSSAILFYQQYQQRAKKATEDVKKVTDEYADSLDAVSSAQLKGAQSAQGELVTLKLLYDRTQNLSLSTKQRGEAVDELQKKYPAYFGNLKDEAILAGQAGGKYLELANGIIAAARARAASDLIVKDQSRRLENGLKIRELQKERVELLGREATLRDRIKNAQGNAVIGLARDLATVEGQITENKATQRNIATDILKLDERSLQLTKSINKETEKPILEDPKAPKKAKKAKKLKILPTKEELEDERAELILNVKQAVLDYDYSGVFNQAKEKIKDGLAEGGPLISMDSILPKNMAKLVAQDLDMTFKGWLKQVEDFETSINDLIKGSVVPSIADAFSSLGQALANGDPVLEAFGKSALMAIAEFLGQLGKLIIKHGITMIAYGVAKNIVAPGSGVKEIAGGIGMVAAGSLVSVGSGLLGSVGSSSKGGLEKTERPRKIPGFANGVRDFSGGIAVVGERGPELVSLPTGSSVIPNHNLSSFGGGDITFNVSSRIDQLGNLITAIDRERSRLRRVGA